MPFATNRYLNLLRGNASDAWQNGGGATVGAHNPNPNPNPNPTPTPRYASENMVAARAVPEILGLWLGLRLGLGLGSTLNPNP